MELTTVSSHRVFGGQYHRLSFTSNVLTSQTTFGIYLPEITTAKNPLPVLYWLSGLTCSDEHFMQKSGVQRLANHYGWVVVVPDTSPRGETIPDDPEGTFDLGLGAGFYLNATQAPWSKHYRMYDFVLEELPILIEKHFPVTQERAISGHSMGGHGALVIGLRNPDRYLSITAFSPICHPSNCPWGSKAFNAYLGQNQQKWLTYDATCLVKNLNSCPPILIDQGTDDEFLDSQLKPLALEQLCKERQLPLELRFQKKYDHSYFFVATFLEDHLEFHTRHLSSQL